MQPNQFRIEQPNILTNAINPNRYLRIAEDSSIERDRLMRATRIAIYVTMNDGKTLTQPVSRTSGVK